MALQDLSTTQRQFLRRSAHALKPTIQIGKNGITPQLIAGVGLELDAHELIKVKFMEFREEKRELAEDLATQLAADLVALIGNTAILYRQQRDPEKRKISLPW
ncbi:MAG: ribosome assembly RNA-binding protein YhbY [Roseiflexaceae bacterium]|nr:ribosome assembly RNA-binding protein YhbY [Roseiflexaceae bacterium]